MELADIFLHLPLAQPYNTPISRCWTVVCSRLPQIPHPPPRLTCCRPYRILTGWPGKLLIWFLLWCYFILMEWGAVFFIISLMIVMWKSMPAKKENNDGPSAYSVFNPECERLPGTFTAEEFDNSLRTGMGLI